MGRPARARIGVAAAALAAGLALSAAAAPATGLRGTFRATLTAHELLSAGAANTEALADTGTWTLTLAPARWTLSQAGGAFGNSLDRGTLTRLGARLYLVLLTADGAPHHDYVGTVRLVQSGAVLRFAPVLPEPSDLVPVLAATSWQRVG